MQRASTILTSLLLLLAITALTFSSCNVSRKGGRSSGTVPTEQVAAQSGQEEVTATDEDGGALTEDGPAVDDPEDGPAGEGETTEDTSGTESGEASPGEEESPVTEPTEETAGEDIPYDDIPYEEESPAPDGGGETEEDTESPEESETPVEGTPGQEPSPEEPATDIASEPEPEYIGDDDPEISTADTYRPEEEEEEGPNMKKVDFYGDIMRPLRITDDSTATYLLGNVIFYHNGAVITCDSAVRYSERRMDCFKRVVINNGTTYVYGDRAVYNGETNTARVYAPIIKVVDEDATLYTYRFSFNTLTKIGRYSGGGVLTQEDNHMESERGYYDTETRLFTGAGAVELTNPDYKLVSDSVRYNLDTEVAEFFTTTHIWNDKGEILIADRGRYHNASTNYEFTRNSYILTDNQEIWADTLKHNSLDDYTELRKDIQIIDEENNTMAFGDYGEYWGETEMGLLTVNPSLISFDPEEPADTLYMRSDSMFFYTYDYDIDFFKSDTQESDGIPAEELIEGPGAPGEIPEGGTELPTGSITFDENGMPVISPRDEDPFPEEGVFPDGMIPPEGDGYTVVVPENEPGEPLDEEDIERLAGSGDIEGGDLIGMAEELDSDKKSKRRNKKDDESKMSRRERKAAEKADADTVEMPQPDEDEDTEITGPDGTKEPETDPDREGGEEEAPVEEPEPYVNPYAELAGLLQETIATDSTGRELTATEFWLQVQEEINADSLRREYYTTAIEEALNAGAVDTLGITVPAGSGSEIIEALITESAAERESLLAAGQTEGPQDSLQRVFYGYQNVRIFRDDFQAVCDSLVGFSKDSTMHLHIDPVMWTDQNQITSDVMVIFSRAEQLYKAEFSGSPFMASEVDTTRYNQVKGKFMVAWFEDNSIYRHDVFGNGQNHYYMEDDKTGDIDGFMTVECADITYYIEENQIDEIRWRGDPVYWIYPIDMIPPAVDEFLPGFKWEAHRRPLTKEDVHTRTIRPRRREQVLAVPHPDFPITEELNETKERLINNNLWRDRNDRLSPATLEFMHEIDLRDGEGKLTILPREEQTEQGDGE